MGAEFRDFKVELFRGGISYGYVKNVKSCRVTLTSKAKTNSLELVVNNRANYLTDGGDLRFQQDDIIKVYAAAGIVDTSNSDHLIGTFFVKNFELQPEGKSMKLICGDHTFDLLNRIYFSTGTAHTARDNIFNIVQTVNEQGYTQNSIEVDMPLTKHDGDPFKEIQYPSATKTAYVCVNDLSQQEMTGDDREYLFWFDENNKFHWKYPNNDVMGNIIYGLDPVLSMQGGLSESDTISSVIFNCGTDLNGTGITGFYHDDTSYSTNIKNVPMIDISRDLKFLHKAEIDAGTYTNSMLIDDAVLLGEGRARRIISNVGTGTWKSTVKVRGQKYPMSAVYIVGDVTNNFAPQRMRLKRVVHTMDKNGWSTQLELEQDPKFE